MAKFGQSCTLGLIHGSILMRQKYMIGRFHEKVIGNCKFVSPLLMLRSQDRIVVHKNTQEGVSYRPSCCSCH